MNIKIPILDKKRTFGKHGKYIKKRVWIKLENSKKDHSSGLKIVQHISFPVISAVYELTQKDGRGNKTEKLV